MEKENKKSKKPLIITVSIILVVIIALAIFLAIILMNKDFGNGSGSNGDDGANGTGNNGANGSNEPDDTIQTETKLAYSTGDGADGGLLYPDSMREVFEDTVEIKYYSDYQKNNCELITETVSLDSFILGRYYGDDEPSDNDYRYYKEITFFVKFDQRLALTDFRYVITPDLNKSYLSEYGSNAVYFSHQVFDENSIYDDLPPSAIINNKQPNAGYRISPLAINKISTFIPSKSDRKFIIHVMQNTDPKTYWTYLNNSFTNSDGMLCYRMTKFCITSFTLKIDPTIF